jgi:hypothetical protein
MTDFFSALDNRISDFRADHPEIADLADQHNLAVDHTGGGCLAFAWHQPDRWYLWLTSGDGGSLPEDVEEKNCIGGFYEPNGDYSTCVYGTPDDILSVKATILNVSKTLHILGREAQDLRVADMLALAVKYQAVQPEEQSAVDAILARTVTPVLRSDSPSCAVAIAEAVRSLAGLAATDPRPEEKDRLLAIIGTLQAILMQRGCESFDPVVKDGKLTTLMDVAIFG